MSTISRMSTPSASLFVRDAVGAQPFTGEDSADRMGKHIYEEPPPLSGALLVPWIPQPLIDLVHSLLVKGQAAAADQSRRRWVNWWCR